jgi:SAM-dependent methyltransferase
MMTTSFSSSLASPVSPWVMRFAPLIPAGGAVLDLACGSGRHSRFLVGRAHPVLAVDRDTTALAGLAGVTGIETLQADLEGPASDPWPLAGRTFAGIVVTCYLHRPRFSDLAALVANPGVLIYETFMAGHERFGKPSRPDFLLQPQELLGWARTQGWRVVAYEEGEVGGADGARPAVLQRLCAVSGDLPVRL